jgi:hypothetical protein
MIHEKALAAIIRAIRAKSAKPAGSPRAFAGFAGRWKNEYGSIADFTINGSNVTGTYTSTVSGTGNTISGPIVGQVAGDAIAFTVLWPTTAPSITSWVGQVIIDVNTKQETLETLWHLVMDISEDPNEVWESVFAGADVFSRI